MTRSWTFGKKLAAGFAVPIAFVLAMASASLYALRIVVESKDHVIDLHARMLEDTRILALSVVMKGEALRSFLLLRDERHLGELDQARKDFADALERLRSGASADDDERTLDAIAASEQAHQRGVENVLALQRAGTPLESVTRTFEREVVPLRKHLSTQIVSFVTRQDARTLEERRAADVTTSRLTWLVALLAVATLLGSVGAGLVLVRGLDAQIGLAVGQVQSSAAELQSAANQQLTGIREQTTAMTEITTTISELLATSRQIADSSQRVAQVSQQSATSAERGSKTVEHGLEAMSGIRRQVDSIVAQMLELGKKSQEVGAVLDIVAELSEQTNILAINATIEAAGAGESGQRFGVVADEIRKLSDRVAAATKEIRALIEDVRGSVNATIVTTETGSKAVDAGSKEFSEVTAAFAHIARLVADTTEASREIELSTKQQASAVEQVDAAVSSVALAAKENEASSGQTLQTASQLAELSRALVRMMRADAAAR
jgi:CHASE3 domain sensor protein